MIRVFLDTNILIDLLAQRSPFYLDAAKLFTLGDKDEIKLFISSLTLANTHYILSKQLGGDRTRKVLRDLNTILEILPLDHKVISLALNDQGFNDFEDAIQYFTALNGNQDFLITRNLKDFKNVKDIPVMDAKSFLKVFEERSK